MATLYIPALLGQGRQPKAEAAYQKQLWNPRKSVVLMAWPLMIAFFIFAAIFSTDSLISSSAVDDGHSDTLPPSIGSSISTQDNITPPPWPDSNVTKLIDLSVGGCNIWRGDWIPHPHEPPYTNTTCAHIQEAENCMKLGRPDSDYLYWRWKPYDCELPLFDAKAFLKIVAGKKWAFIGDSLARNNFQSVVCHLAVVEKLECVYNVDGVSGNIRCYVGSYNFTIATAWAPFLVKGEGFVEGVDKLDLDVVDDNWASLVHDYDYIVLSAGRWYMRTSVYFVQNELVGCFNCRMSNTTDVGAGFAYKAALRTTFDFLIASKYKGVVFFRTFSPDHWRNGSWDRGGTCTQKAPFRSSATAFDGLSQFIYPMQLEEFGKIVQRSSEYSFKLQLLDTIHAAVLRPDAHPGAYGLKPNSRAQSDCAHWCLPGAVDAWSAMILHALKHLS
ncbi:hypothetical protein GOP47_0028138 [Adiantum capillus-veneris]|nr:hypothetical protein GOP47_0028138 [Adiantum capillus-veneris]